MRCTHCGAEGKEKPRMPEVKRMWINQPSTAQPMHERDGENVLAVLEYDTTYRVYLLHGDVVSMQMLAEWLSPGWIQR
jgi:hypothetical protein